MSKIAIITDSNLLQEGIIHILQEKLPEHEVTAHNSRQEERLFQEQHAFDLVILEINRKIQYFKLVEMFLNKRVKAAVWTSEIENVDLPELFRLDLNGYLFNGMKMRELIHAIETMLRGEQYIHPHLTRILIKEYKTLASRKPKRPVGVLTEREWDVLALIVEGCNNSSIAKRLFVSATTVNNHVASILRKLDVPDRTNAALEAVKNGWFILR